MKFDDLDRKMRVFETAADHCVLPKNIYGRSARWSRLYPAHQRSVFV